MKHGILGFLASIPIGAGGGFICAALVAGECVLWRNLVFDRASAHDDSLTWPYMVAVGEIPGALLGAIVLPIAYLISLRMIPMAKIGRAVLYLFIGVLVPSILFSALQELAAFTAACLSFFISCMLITLRFVEPNQSRNPAP
jgi:hypothetical protein